MGGLASEIHFYDPDVELDSALSTNAPARRSAFIGPRTQSREAILPAVDADCLDVRQRASQSFFSHTLPGVMRKGTAWSQCRAKMTSTSATARSRASLVGGATGAGRGGICLAGGLTCWEAHAHAITQAKIPQHKSVHRCIRLLADRLDPSTATLTGTFLQAGFRLITGTNGPSAQDERLDKRRGRGRRGETTRNPGSVEGR